ncbi:hypothetical protein GCM10011375_40060 [Hymenobacter qilianensis]|uniref:Uncharacterized protein n=1 Tax=Hymenobacter qilianensis TaxID=1385715 RepID=A0ACB5PX77_9BACT|nr:DUF6122 family protein [Hymenobacter qilianensis]GGF81083.1 hypothetical protein GCM10011375_40060 [Hymenobacter qilianensis]
MLPLSVVRRLLSVAAGLVLALTGCRSSAIVPTFSDTGKYHPSRPVPRVDTTTAVTAQEYRTTLPRRVKAEGRPQVADTRDHVRREKKEPAGEPGRRYARATPGDTVRSATRPVAPREPRQYASPTLFSAQTLVHYGLHFVFPVVLALVFFPLVWQTAYLIMLATMAIDLDHLLAKPIFDPLRCSIGYHPLHSFYAIPVYALLLLLPATQMVAVGLLFHLFTDTVDCLWNFSHCRECYLNSRIYALRNWVRKLLGREVAE